MKTDRKPPLARSPMRLRGRRVLKPSNIVSPFRTPPAAMTKPQVKGSEIRPEYLKISCELSALSKMVQEELGAMNAKNYPKFEKGLFYDEYIARRNERLRRKQRESEVNESKTAYSLRVKVDTTKKKDFKKKAESLKKSVAATYSVERSQHPRYALRSVVKKPPLPVPMNVEEKMTARKTGAVSRLRRE